MPAKQIPVKCMVIGNSVVRGVGADHTNIRVKSFRGSEPNSYTK
jgi:hypothetical protein